jgi:hypothetical protein
MAQTMSAQAHEEAVRERLEAEFLRSDIRFEASGLEPLLPVTEIADGPPPEMDMVRTTRMPTYGNGCCRC